MTSIYEKFICLIYKVLLDLKDTLIELFNQELLLIKKLINEENSFQNVSTTTK